jgi:hypothetical protein
MPPLPPESTPRYIVHYQVLGGPEHSLQVRAPATVSPAAFGTFINSFLSPLVADLWQITILGVDFIPSGTNVGNPVITGIEGNTYGSGSSSQASIPLSLSFVGRSSGGRRGRIFLFGFKIGDPNYRFAPGENVGLDAARAVLVGASGYPLAIDGLELVFKPYANMGWNDHWIRELRG